MKFPQYQFLMKTTYAFSFFKGYIYDDETHFFLLFFATILQTCSGSISGHILSVSAEWKINFKKGPSRVFTEKSCQVMRRRGMS
jgi:hypothetical protein